MSTVQAPILAALTTGVIAFVIALLNIGFTSRLHSRLTSTKIRSEEGMAHLRASTDEKLAQLAAGAARDLEEHKDVLAQAAKKRDEQTEQQRVLDLYRKPLTAAADDLGNRINNIRYEHFFEGYLAQGGDRRKLALLTTLYRFARFFGWVETLERRVTFLEFGDDNATRTVAGALRNVSGTFSTDQYGQELMLWREEQRAIGGLMRAEGDADAVIGFDTFYEVYEERFSSWFEVFARDLQTAGSKEHSRLADLQEQLGELLLALDRERLHDAQRSWWLRATSAYSRMARSHEPASASGDATTTT